MQNPNLQRTLNMNDRFSVNPTDLRKKVTITDIANTKITLVKKGKSMNHP
jgi:hypothetical protein